ncbi:MAG: hypothetical protein KAQ98_02920 [Bacteriovoracaceae bacterium]|nr:hypothetical protein [Bacteriovoracaceae bacterium]
MKYVIILTAFFGLSACSTFYNGKAEKKHTIRTPASMKKSYQCYVVRIKCANCAICKHSDPNIVISNLQELYGYMKRLEEDNSEIGYEFYLDRKIAGITVRYTTDRETAKNMLIVHVKDGINNDFKEGLEYFKTNCREYTLDTLELPETSL